MTFSEKRQLRRKFQAEVDLAAVYDAMATAQGDPALSAQYARFASTERENAAGAWIRLWENGVAVPKWRRSIRGRLFSVLARGTKGLFG